MGGLAFAAGYGVGITIVSPVEWLVHKYILHRPKEKRMFLNKGSSEAHNDVHHAVYSGPNHYFRDETNKDQVIHFSHGDRAVILGSSLVGGLGVERAYAYATGNESFDAGIIAGFTTAAMFGYAGYEFTHHYMHAVGDRRVTINRELGDIVQGGEADGRLRFSKPLLDDVCNSVENFVDKNDLYTPEHLLEEELGRECEINRQNGVHIADTRTSDVLNAVAYRMKSWEENIRESLSGVEKLSYHAHRGIQRALRSDSVIGRWFAKKDNNHFVHHKHYLNNLNVFMLWADKAFGTRIDSSREALKDNQKYWLCPNPI